MPLPSKPFDPLPTKDVIRFEQKFQKSEGCWEWQARIDTSGYGTFRHSGRSLIAHRVAYAIYVGPIPDGKHVLHRCDNRRCVNPDHLFIGTNRDNILDRNAKGRANTLRGELCPWAKLTQAQVNKIRAEYKRSSKIASNAKQLAVKYGVTKGTVLQIVRKTSWNNQTEVDHAKAEEENQQDTTYPCLGFEPGASGGCACLGCCATREERRGCDSRFFRDRYLASRSHPGTI